MRKYFGTNVRCGLRCSLYAETLASSGQFFTWEVTMLAGAVNAEQAVIRANGTSIFLRWKIFPSLAVLFCKSIWKSAVLPPFPSPAYSLQNTSLFFFILSPLWLSCSVLLAYCSTDHQKPSPSGKANGLHACMVCMHVLKPIVFL